MVIWEPQQSYQMDAVRNGQSDTPSVCFSWRFMWRSAERPGGCCDLGGNLRRLSTRRRFHRLEFCFPRDHRRASSEQPLSPEASKHLLSYDFFQLWGCFVLHSYKGSLMALMVPWRTFNIHGSFQFHKRFQNMFFHSDAIKEPFLVPQKVFQFFSVVSSQKNHFFLVCWTF